MSAGGPPSAAVDGAGARPASARRLIGILAASQVLNALGISGAIVVGGPLAEQLSGSTSLAGVSQTMSVLGGAIFAVPLARLAIRTGRRAALGAGLWLGAVGALACCAAAAAGSFLLLCVGTLLLGGSVAAGLQSRYAAVDAASASQAGRSLSIVVWASTIGAVLGPNLSGPSTWISRQLGLPDLAGAYVICAAVSVLAAALIGARLRPDPLQLAAEEASGAPSGGSASGSTGAALRAVTSSPPALLGLVAMGSAHAVMVALMSMTPVHLHGHGVGLGVVGGIISGHIVGMYALSPVMGWISDRFGPNRGVALGLVLLAAAAGLVMLSQPAGPAGFSVGLFLLGVGWSACLISGSVLLSTLSGTVRTSAQGLSDLVMGAAGASAGALAGPLLAWGRFTALGAAAMVIMLPVAVLLARETARQRRVALVSNTCSG